VDNVGLHLYAPDEPTDRAHSGCQDRFIMILFIFLLSYQTVSFGNYWNLVVWSGRGYEFIKVCIMFKSDIGYFLVGSEFLKSLKYMRQNTYVEGLLEIKMNNYQ
jgi:hypothetical protein